MKHDTPHPSDPAFGVHLGVIPFDRSYWVVPGRLLAGVYPSSDNQAEATDKLQRLLEVGVRHIINLTEPVEKNWKGVPLSNYEPELKALATQQNLQIVCRRHLIRDLDVPSIATMKNILNDIDEVMQASKTAYVHCWGGRGRTGLVVGCFLARHGMATGESALKMIRYLRRTDAKADTEAPETLAQKEFVRTWPIGQ
jgi:protein-tyrosine phosphatase